MTKNPIRTIHKRSLAEWKEYLDDTLLIWAERYKISDNSAAQHRQVLEAFQDLIEQVVTRQ